MNDPYSINPDLNDRDQKHLVQNIPATNEAPPVAKPVGAWSRFLVATVAAFVLTVLMMVVAAFSQQAPKLARFFDEHGLAVLGIEVGVIVGLAVVVLAIERRGSR